LFFLLLLVIHDESISIQNYSIMNVIVHIDYVSVFLVWELSLKESWINLGCSILRYLVLWENSSRSENQIMESISLPKNMINLEDREDPIDILAI